MKESTLILQNIETNKAALPQVYSNAVSALQQCNSIDECKEWSDKMAALASYWKQANDDDMWKLAKRIQARAYRRAGELLKQFDAKGRNQYTEDSMVNLTKLSQKEVAEQAGFSKNQKDTAVRLANVPEDKFDAQVESDNPPTITALAEQGKRSILSSPKPEGFAKAIHIKGAFKELTAQMDKYDAIYIIGGMDDRDVKEMKDYIQVVENWIDTFMINT